MKMHTSCCRILQGCKYSRPKPLCIRNLEVINKPSLSSTYCDENAPTPGSVFCDGGLFTGVHFLKSDNVYCQWAIGPDPTKCYDGKTGKVVPRPSSAVAHVVVTNTSIPEGYFQMLHVQYPDLARAMWNEVTDGPMPPGYTPITSIEQWLSMNRTAAIMPPRR